MVGVGRSWSEMLGKNASSVSEGVRPRNNASTHGYGASRLRRSLSMRTHVCPRCGLILDRDENAAVNILARGVGAGAGTLAAGNEGYRGAHGNVTPGDSRAPAVG